MHISVQVLVQPFSALTAHLRMEQACHELLGGSLGRPRLLLRSAFQWIGASFLIRRKAERSFSSSASLFVGLEKRICVLESATCFELTLSL